MSIKDAKGEEEGVAGELEESEGTDDQSGAKVEGVKGDCEAVEEGDEQAAHSYIL